MIEALHGVVNVWLDEGEIDDDLAERLRRLVDRLPALLDQVEEQKRENGRPRIAQDEPGSMAEWSEPFPNGQRQ